MFNKLLLTTALLVSSTFGADAQILNEGLDSMVCDASNTVEEKAETSASTLDALGRIQSVFVNSNATDEEIKDAILQLSKVLTICRYEIMDICSDGYKPTVTFDITPPEIEHVVKAHSSRILAPLIAMLSESAPASEKNNDLYGLFLTAFLVPDLTPELLEIYISDKTLSFISAWLASSDSNKKFLSMLLVSLLINSVTDPSHIARLQELSITHLSAFLEFEGHGSLSILLLKLASLNCDNTSHFIYELHKELLKILFGNYVNRTSPNGPATIKIPEDVQNQPTYKHAHATLMILHNYRDQDLNQALDYLGIKTAGLELELLTIDSIKDLKLIQEGNPTHRNRDVTRTTGSIVLGENLQTMLTKLRVHDFLRKSGLGDLISNPSDASTD